MKPYEFSVQCIKKTITIKLNKIKKKKIFDKKNITNCTPSFLHGNG